MPIEQQPTPVLEINQTESGLQQPVVRKNSIWLPMLGAFLIGGLFFGVAAYFFGQRAEAPVVDAGDEMAPRPLSSDATTSAVTTPSTTPQGDVQLTAPSDWKTYTNTTMKDRPKDGFIYSIKYPEGWSTDLNVFTNADPTYPWTSDRLTLTNGDRELEIFRPGPSGGGGCLFPEDADMEGPYGRLGKYVDLTIDGQKYRRAIHLEADGNAQKYTVCQLYEESGLYGTPTNFGHILYTVPVNSDVTELDAILTTLARQ